MKRELSIFVLAALLLSASAQSQDDKSDVKVIGLEADLDLRSDQVVTLTDEALRGSGEAGLRLALYYANVKLDLSKSEYWTHISAENGNAVAQYNEWVELSQSEKADDRKRALFWLRKSAAQGNGTAQRELKDIADSGT